MNLIYTVMKYIASDKWVPRARVIWLTSAGYPVCLIYYPSSITSIHSKHPSSGLTYTQPMDCKPVWYWILGSIFIISHHCIDNRIRNHSSCKIRTCVSRTLSVIADCCWHKDTGHHQPWYWSRYPEYSSFGNRRINTLRPRQMDTIFQTTFSNTFLWMKMNEFRLKFRWSLLSRVKLTIFHHWFR